MRFRSVRLDPYLLLLFLLSLFVLAPLFAPGYFYSAHDGRHSVFYVTMFDEAIRSGALWPRWAMHHNQGYGYPTFLVQAPFALYVAELFVLLGAGVTQAVKLTWAAGILCGAWGMYALVRHWILDTRNSLESTALIEKSPAKASACALIAGLLYTYAPYHLLDIYVRAAFAETLLMAWFPWVFLAFDRLIIWGGTSGWQGRLAAAALIYAGLLLTHGFALVAFTPLLAAWILFRLWVVWRRQRISHSEQRMSEQMHSPEVKLLQRMLLAAGAGIAGGLLAAIFLIPLLIEAPLLVQEEWTRDTYNYTRHWVHWGQFFSPFWGYGYSDDPSGANDGMGFQLGVMVLLPALLCIYLLFDMQIGKVRQDVSSFFAGQREVLLWVTIFLLVASFSILAFMTPGAAVLWRIIPLLEVIQFPWRLLSLATFTLSALGGSVFWQYSRWEQLQQPGHEGNSGLFVVAILVCFAGLGYSRPAALQPIEPWREDGRAVMQFEQEHPDMIATTRLVGQRFADSPMTEQYQAAEFSTDSLQRLVILSGEGQVIDQYSKGHAFGGEVNLASPATVQIRLYAFPGWQVKVDGVPVEYRVSPPYGLMEVDVASGRHQIDVWMGTTRAMRVGMATSLLTLSVLAGLWLFGSVRARKA